jgi:hypothetical protein
MNSSALRSRAQAQKAENNLIAWGLTSTFNRLQRYKEIGELASAGAILDAALMLSEPQSNWPTFFLWSINVGKMNTEARSNKTRWWHDQKTISYPYEYTSPEGKTRQSNVPLLAGLLELQKNGRGVTEPDMFELLPFSDPVAVSRILPVFLQKAAITLPGDQRLWIPSAQIAEAYARYSSDSTLSGQGLMKLQVFEDELWKKLPPLSRLAVQFAMRELAEVRYIDNRLTIFPVNDRPYLKRADKFHSHKTCRYVILADDEFRREEGIADDRVDILTMTGDLFHRREDAINEWVVPQLNSHLRKIRPRQIYDERRDTLTQNNVLGNVARR